MARKDEILDALIDIFKNQGMSSDFTMSQLAQKVNIGKSTIYEYFKTKEEVLQEALSRLIETSISQIFSREFTNESFEEMYKSELKFLFTSALQSRYLISVLSPEFGKVLPEGTRQEVMKRMKHVGSFYQERFQNIFLKGVEEGIIGSENMEINNIMISSLVTGSIMRFANSNVELIGNIDIDEYIDAVYKASIRMTK